MDKILKMRADLDALMAKAAAKQAEMKDGLAADAISGIERDHAILLAQADAKRIEITAEETRIADVTPAAKAWAAPFYASAESSGIAIKDLNAIVASASSHDQAKDALIDAMAKASIATPSPTGARLHVGQEAQEKFVTGATRAIIARAAMFNERGRTSPDGERNEFSGYTMRELARMSLETRGIRPDRDSMTMITTAMQPVIMGGALSTSDFVNILANVANKGLLKGYEEAAETFDKWTGKGTLSDFKASTRVDLGLFPSLSKVDEGAEYRYASLTDRKVQLILSTYGNLFPITRQAIINDDLGVFTKVPSRMGQAAKRTIANLVWAILTSNPNAPDGTALFHNNHANLATGGGSALSADSLDAARAKMATQKDPDNIKQALNIKPAYFLVPAALEGKARQLMASQTEPGQSNPGVANRVAGLAEVISEGRLDINSTTAWYLASNANQVDTIEVDYLDGNEAPMLEQKEGWNVDGVEFKVRQDVGVTLLDFRGLYKGAGA